MADDSGTPQTNKPKLVDLLTNNIVWWSLGLLAVGVAGSFGAIKYINEYIDTQITLRLKPQIENILSSDEWVNMLKAHRRDADNAVEAATVANTAAMRASQASTEKLRQASDDSEAVKKLAKELQDKYNQASNLVDIANLGEKIDYALEKPSFRDAVIARVLPSGAIVAFETSQGCPPGWKSADNLSGRFVIGAGPNNNLDANGRVLSTYSFEQTGGTEQHTLSIDEMPPHSHGLETLSMAPMQGFSSNPFNAALKATDAAPSQFSGSTTSIGGGRSFTTMPPYAALFYCRKEG